MFPLGDDLGDVVALGVRAVGDLKHILRAEVNAYLTSLAALGDEEDFAARDANAIGVKGSAGEDSHLAPASMPARTPPSEASLINLINIMIEA
jgi:hypothetical protein